MRRRSKERGCDSSQEICVRYFAFKSARQSQSRNLVNFQWEDQDRYKIQDVNYYDKTYLNAGDFQSIASIIGALKYCYLVALVKNELLVLPALPSKQLARLGRGPSKDSPFPRSMAALVIPPLLSSVRPPHHHSLLSVAHKQGPQCRRHAAAHPRERGHQGRHQLLRDGRAAGGAPQPSPAQPQDSLQ